LFEQMLVELGGGDMTRDRAATVMAKWVAREVLSGSMTPAEATRQAYDLNDRTDDEYEGLFGRLALLEYAILDLDENGGTLNGSTYDEVAAEVVAEVRRLLAE